MFATMIDLMNEGIPSLAVHDSIIVPVLGRNRAAKVLTKHYQRCANATPVLIHKLPSW
jgi:hypothetical protein